MIDTEMDLIENNSTDSYSEGEIPRLTIGMPVFNGAATIRASLASLLGQTFRDFILIISDNDSSDGTFEICQEYARHDHRVRVVRQPRNLGPVLNFRFLLFEARTPYFMWAAADDTWASTFVERNISFLMDHPDYVMSQARVLFTLNGQPDHIAAGTYALCGTPRENAARFFLNPSDNSRYYGIYRTAALQATFPPRSFFASDWVVTSGTLRFGRHNEIDDVLMIRDSSDSQVYERLLSREHNFVLWRIFPILFLTKYLVLRRVVPLSPRLLYALFRLNVYMHLRFGQYRWQRLADHYLQSHALLDALRRAVSGSIAEVVPAGVQRSLGQLRRQVRASVRRLGYGVWRRLPMSHDQRLAIKRGVFRVMPRLATRLPGYETWTPTAVQPVAAEPQTDTTSGLALPVFALQPVERPEGFVPTVSVVVVITQGITQTLDLLDSLARGSDDLAYEVVLVDCGNRDITEAALRHRGDVAYVPMPATTSFVQAANIGVGQARGETLVFLEPGGKLCDGFLRLLLGALETTAMVGPQVRSRDGVLCAAGARFTPDLTNLYVGHGDNPQHPRYQTLSLTDFCPGGFAITRFDYSHAGGFEERFSDLETAGADLALRLAVAGCRVAVQSRAWLISARPMHPGGKSGQTGANDADWDLLLARYKTLLGPIGSGRLISRADAGAPRILYVDADTPAPDQNAGSIFAINMMRIFRELGYRITFVPDSNLAHQGRYTEALQDLGIEPIWFPFYDSIASVIDELADELDVVVLCRAHIAEKYLELVRNKAPQAKVVFNTVDMHFLRLQREADLTGDVALRAEAERTRESEFASIRQADATIVVSSYEQEMLRKELPDARIDVIPLIFEMPDALDVPGPADRKDIMFVGTYQHPPNADAAVFFAKEIWPIVRRTLPDARFLIVGSSVTPEIDALAGDGVQVLGFVPDLQPLLDRCRVSVAPLRFGAGMKGKVITTLLAGLPTVGTTIAFEGTSVTPGKEAIVAETPEELAEGVVRLYTDEKLWGELSRAGFDLVKREYSYGVNLLRIRRLLQGMARGALGAPEPVRMLSTLSLPAEGAEQETLYRPSHFWQRLQDSNTRLLTDLSVLNFKRTVANNYFQWLPTDLSDPQIRNLIRLWSGRPSDWPVRAVAQSGKSPELNVFADFGGQNPFTARPDYFSVYCFFVALLWDYAASLDEARLFERLEEPALGNPLPVYLDGKLISQDLGNSLIEYSQVRALMQTAGTCDEPRIIEIGAGYGRLAYVFLRGAPCKYVIVDIQPALTLAEWYLRNVLPEVRVFGFREFARFEDVADEMIESDLVFLSMKQVELLPDGFCDAAVSISSLHEMRIDQIEFYKRHIDRLTTGCVYIKQWAEWHNPLDHMTVGRANYLMPTDWALVLDRRHPVQQDFCELGFVRREVAVEVAEQSVELAGNERGPAAPA